MVADPTMGVPPRALTARDRGLRRRRTPRRAMGWSAGEHLDVVDVDLVVVVGRVVAEAHLDAGRAGQRDLQVAGLADVVREVAAGREVAGHLPAAAVDLDLDVVVLAVLHAAGDHAV